LQTKILPEYSFLHDFPVFSPAIHAGRLSCRPCHIPEEDWLSIDVPRGEHIDCGKREQQQTKLQPFFYSRQDASSSCQLTHLPDDSCEPVRVRAVALQVILAPGL
jgi:hypothetical protein